MSTGSRTDASPNEQSLRFLAEKGRAVQEQIVELLRSSGVLPDDRARELKKRGWLSGDSFLRGLSESVDVVEERVAEAFSSVQGLTRWDPEAGPRPDSAATSLVPEEFARRHRLFPLHRSGEWLEVVAADPSQMVALDAISVMTGLKVRVVVAVSGAVSRELDRLHGLDPEQPPSIPDELLRDLSESAASERAAGRPVAEVGLGEKAPIIRLVNLILHNALRFGATDILIESFEGPMRVRYRIGGTLRLEMSVPKAADNWVLNRLKIMAGMDLTGRHRSQVGRISVLVDGRPGPPLLVRSLPTHQGELIHLRVVPEPLLLRGLDGLGLAPGDRSAYEAALLGRSGLGLIVGPTRSGRTTTLYATLRTLASRGIHVLSIEDRVEYCLPWVRQIDLGGLEGPPSRTLLEDVLAQGPSVLALDALHGETRLRVALRAVEEGCLVIGTVAALDLEGAMQCGDWPGECTHALIDALVFTVHQGLLRKTCPDCPPGSVASCTTCLGEGSHGLGGNLEMETMTQQRRTELHAQSRKVRRLTARSLNRGPGGPEMTHASPSTSPSDSALLAKRRLGEILVSLGRTTGEKIEAALARQLQTGRRIGECLVDLGSVSDRDVAESLSRQLNVPFIDLSFYILDPAIATLIPRAYAEKAGIIAVNKKDDGVLTVVAEDPLNVHVLDQVEQMTGLRAKAVVGSAAQIRQAIKETYDSADELNAMPEEMEGDSGSEATQGPHPVPDRGSFSQRLADGNPAARLLARLFLMATKRRAQEVVVIPSPADPGLGRGTTYRIVFLRDRSPAGTLDLPVSAGRAVMNLVWDLLGDRLGARRGRLSAEVDGVMREVKIFPLKEAAGESALLRILEPWVGMKGAEELGLEHSGLDRLRQAMQASAALIVAAGPPRSGRTTTLNALALEAAVAGEFVLSLEDWPDHPLLDVIQVAMKKPIPRTDEPSASAAVTCSPEVILLDEPRGPADGREAWRRAAQGRRVLMPLTALDRAEALDRLRRLGITAEQVPVVFVWHDAPGRRQVEDPCRCCEPLGHDRGS